MNTKTKTPEEIKQKIDALRKSIATKAEHTGMLVFVFLFVIVSTIALFAGGELHEIWKFISGPIIAIIVFPVLNKEHRTKLRRRELANSLEEALSILDEKDGIERFYEILDKSIVERNKNRKLFLVSVLKKHIEQIKREARVEAFTWVITSE